jgi:hypothetical protein
VKLRGEYRLKVFENGRIFGRKREEVAGGWRRLHNEAIKNFYASPNIITVKKVKKELKLPLPLALHHAMKTYLLLN